MSKKLYTYDAATNTLTMSAEFAKKVSVINSKEYRELLQFRRENPGLTVKKNTRKSSQTLTYKDMKTRLQRLENSANYVEAFELVKKIAKGEKNPYAYVYNWFKSVMEAVKTEKQNEKKAAAASTREEDMKRLSELNIALKINPAANPAPVEDEVDSEEEDLEEEYAE